MLNRALGAAVNWAPLSQAAPPHPAPAIATLNSDWNGKPRETEPCRCVHSRLHSLRVKQRCTAHVLSASENLCPKQNFKQLQKPRLGRGSGVHWAVGYTGLKYLAEHFPNLKSEHSTLNRTLTTNKGPSTVSPTTGFQSTRRFKKGWGHSCVNTAVKDKHRGHKPPRSNAGSLPGSHPEGQYLFLTRR